MVDLLERWYPMYYGDEILDNIRNRCNIVDLVGTYVSLKRAGASYKGLCPFHNEKTPSFMVTPSKKMYYCFGCHKGGDVFTFLMDYENMTFTEAVQYLAEREGITLPEVENNAEARRRDSLRETLFEINSLAGQFYYGYLRHPKGQAGMEYLKGRGISDEMLQKFALGYAPQSGGLYRFLKEKGFNDDVLKESGFFGYDDRRGPYDKFWNRVMFPIVDRRNHVIGFGGRVMGEGEPKYLNSRETPVFDKGRNLYGINYIHGKLDKGLILCEGYMDVIALHQAGFTNAVAALGTAFTDGHASLIKRMTDLVYVCFDSDQAGTKAAMKAVPMLRKYGIRTKVIRMEPHKDPDEFIKHLGREAFEERIENARISFFFEVDVIAKKYDMEDPGEKTRFMMEIADRIIEFEDEVERTNYIEAFAREYGVRSDDFRTMVIKQSAKRVGIDYDKRQEERSARQGHAPKEDAVSEGQGILLTWLCEHPENFGRLKQYVSPDDFIDEPYTQVAKEVFDQLEKTGQVEPASILGHFEDPETQNIVAGIFHKEVEGEEDKEVRTISEVVMGIMKASLEYRSAHATGIEEVQKLLEDRKRLQQIRIDL
ncbi:MAG: DNA primase [Eubacterium sp.]|nr:DNA primase [Eubacterium sp.]